MSFEDREKEYLKHMQLYSPKHLQKEISSFLTQSEVGKQITEASAELLRQAYEATEIELRKLIEKQEIIDSQQLSLEAIRIRAKRLRLSLGSIESICQDLVWEETRQKVGDSCDED